MGTLVDPFGRNIEYLRISVVDRCNLRCFYCQPGEHCKPRGVRKPLSRQQFKEIAEAAASCGIRKIRLTGGEPLMRSDILELVHDIARIPGIDDLSLTTNGTRLASLARPLKKAGLNRVNISLDSLDEGNFSKITRGGDIKATLDGIDAAYEIGLRPLKINMVVMKGINDQEIEQFSRLVFEKDIHVRFIEYMPLLGQDETWKQYYLPSDEIKKRFAMGEKLIPVPEEDLHGPAKNYTVRGAKGILGLITPVSQHFCSSCNRLRLTSDGKLRPCLFSTDEVDLLPALLAGKDLVPLFVQAVNKKPLHEDISPASLGSTCGPNGMFDIGG